MKIFNVILICLFALFPTLSLASDYSSSSFNVQDPSLGTGGGTSSSANFVVHGQAGVTAPAISTSTSFVAQGGSQYFNNTPPLSGAVYDGASAGLETGYQDSMTTLSSNWSGFSDPQVGLAKYEYMIIRTVDNQCWNAGSRVWGGCAYWVNNALTTNFSITDSNLLLRTGTPYQTCVRATNNAGLMSAQICSVGILINPSLSLALSSTGIQFNNLTTANNYNGTSTTSVQIQTNAYNGYAVYVSKSSPLHTSTTPDNIIPDLNDGGCSGVAVAWPGPTYFGITSDNSVDNNKFNARTTKYCALPTRKSTSTGLATASYSTPIAGAPVTNTHNITYRTQVNGALVAGKYSTQLIYTVVPKF